MTSHNKINALAEQSSFYNKRLPFFVLAGPDVIEDALRPGQTARIAERLIKIAHGLDVPLAFKVSYDKANRTALRNFRGPGLDQALSLFKELKQTFNVLLLSDVHRFEEIEPAAEVLDILQIPAFLSRQTDFLVEVARTHKIVNLKKGQFMAPRDVEHALNKLTSTGNERIILTERGYMFGYNNMVVDMRGFPIMKSFGYPVVIDATHSIQLPSGAGGQSGGERQFVNTIARAAVAAGADGIFMETHDEPDQALCDGPNMINVNDVEDLIRQLLDIYQVVNGR